MDPAVSPGRWNRSQFAVVLGGLEKGPPRENSSSTLKIRYRMTTSKTWIHALTMGTLHPRSSDLFLVQQHKCHFGHQRNCSRNSTSGAGPRPKSIIKGSPLSRSTRMFWMGSTIITSCLWGDWEVHLDQSPPQISNTPQTAWFSRFTHIWMALEVAFLSAWQKKLPGVSNPKISVFQY